MIRFISKYAICFYLGYLIKDMSGWTWASHIALAIILLVARDLANTNDLARN